MEEVIIRQFPTGDFEVFTYVLACPETREAAVIDPAGDPEKLLSVLSGEELQARYIVNTHGHPDHILANQRLKEALFIPVCMHRMDADFFSDPGAQELICKELGLSCGPAVDVKLEDGQSLELGKLRIRVIHTPGHTPGIRLLPGSGEPVHRGYPLPGGGRQDGHSRGIPGGSPGLDQRQAARASQRDRRLAGARLRRHPYIDHGPRDGGEYLHYRLPPRVNRLVGRVGSRFPDSSFILAALFSRQNPNITEGC